MDWNVYAQKNLCILYNFLVPADKYHIFVLQITFSHASIYFLKFQLNDIYLFKIGTYPLFSLSSAKYSACGYQLLNAEKVLFR